ncbi:hypothetical protein FOZ62_031188 [Perkinsus olseni]|uniref:Uncharacterized protein n=1 Tax=Perkinsus olseni TaxID=32597 RepID=A0A7J6QLG6_PEROL|nr:hypothetical protein FOZ62_031188 [Perkinsus olseni]
MILRTRSLVLLLPGAMALQSSASKSQTDLSSISREIAGLAGRINSIENAVRDMSLPADITLMSRNMCKMEGNNKRLIVKLNPHFNKTESNIISYSIFKDDAPASGRVLRYHFGLDDDDRFHLYLSHSHKVRCVTDRVREAHKFFSPFSPFAHLDNSGVAEKLVELFPDQKNPGRCRKIFSLLAANPPEGYDSGIDWVAGFHYTVGSNIDTVNGLVQEWQEERECE